MGYIQVPKLVGGEPEPVINVREMPQEWRYYKTLAEGDYDNCFLFYKGASATFNLTGFVANSYITLYGGLDGMQPLYRCYWSNTAANRYWAHYENGSWVRNTTQPTTFTNCVFADADIDNYPEPFPITLNDLQGKPITNDPHLGTTELFTVVVHSPEGVHYNNGKLADVYPNGGTANNSRYTYPLVAYYGATNGLKAAEAVRTPDLEFVEFYSAESVIATSSYLVYSAYWLGKLTIPDTVTIMYDRGCQNDFALQEVTLPKNLIEIPISLFYGCLNLKKVNFGDALEIIGESSFRNTTNLKKLTLPSTVETIGYYSFADSGIEEINFPSTVTSISNYAFQNTNLKEVILPDTLQNVYSYAFSNCKSLTRAHLPNTFTSISDYLFSGCTSLENVNFPNTLTSIGGNAFYNCFNLKNVTIPSTVTSIGTYAFYGCYSIEEITIPNGCTIGTFAFGYCDNLKKVTLPNDLTTLSNSMFVQCKSMEEYNLPNTITTIGSSVFAYNQNLKKLIIPASVTSIAAYAFNYMGACRYYKFLGSPATLANANAFATGNTYVKILIPYEYIANYRTATNWSSATNNVLRKQRGYKTFQTGDTLPATDSTGTYTLKWYADFNAVLNATVTGTPSAPQITTAPRDGEYYCTIA